jgi:hypothetical protein
MNMKYDNNNIIIASRAYFLHTIHCGAMQGHPSMLSEYAGGSYAGLTRFPVLQSANKLVN